MQKSHETAPDECSNSALHLFQKTDVLIGGKVQCNKKQIITPIVFFNFLYMEHYYQLVNVSWLSLEAGVPKKKAVLL